MTMRVGGQPVPVQQQQEPESTAIKSSESKAGGSESTSTAPKETSHANTSGAAASAAAAERSFTGSALAADITSRLRAADTTASRTDTTATKDVKEPLLYNPSKGPKVLELQKQVNEWRVRNGKEPIKEDEHFGPKTEAAVKEFQKATGLKADGLVGPLTRERLQLENNKNFQSLDADTQAKIRNQLNEHPKNPAARENVTKLVTGDSFAKISKEGQQQALEKLKTNPSDPGHASSVNEAVEDRAYLETHSNFQSLDAGAKAKVLEQFNNSPNTSARRNLMWLGTSSGFAKLSPEQQDLALKAHKNNPASSDLDTHLRGVLGEESFHKMPDATKTRVLDLMATNATNPQYTNSLRNLVNDPKFVALSDSDKTKALNVFEHTTPAGRTELMKLLNKEINGTPALSSRGIGGTGPTLLDQLDRLSTTPLHSSIVDAGGAPQDRAKVTEDLLKELAEPSKHLNQGDRGTCPVTTMSHRLTEQNPAEYARIVTDLATMGQSKLANGAALQLPSDAYRADNSGRSVSERLFQSAVMNYGSGGNYKNWDPGPNGNPGDSDDGPNTVGLSADENVKVMEGLFNRKMERYTGTPYNFKDDKKEILDRTASEISKGNGPVFTGLRWGSGNHVVEIVKIENGRVYYRNPWGPDAASASGGPSTRRTEDAATGLESISEQDYLANVNDVIVDKK